MSAMCRRCVLLVAAVLLGATGSLAQVPPMYQIVTVADWPPEFHNPKMNNHGQIVFVGWYDPSDRRTEEIFLYDHGQLIRLTDDYIQDVGAAINDDGTIVWSRGLGPPDPDDGEPLLQIVLWRDGVLTQLTDTAYDECVGSLNNLGHVVWDEQKDEEPAGWSTNIRFYDGYEIHEITNDNSSHRNPVINDDDWIVWTRYNFCVEPWTSDTMLYANGEIAALTEGQTEPTAPAINNHGQVVWHSYNPLTGLKEIHLWESGQTTLLTDWGMNARINDHGDVYFIRWHEVGRVYQAWLYLRGTFYQLTDDPFWNVDGDINNAGAATWQSGDFPGSDIRYLHPAPPRAEPIGGALGAQDVRPRLP